MRIRTIIPLGLAALILGSGCAMSPEQVDGERANPYDRYDQETISAINRDARRQGVDVIWVNPPMRSESDSDDGA
jgi:soluble lytic murein transglycosylase-like protein